MNSRKNSNALKISDSIYWTIIHRSSCDISESTMFMNQKPCFYLSLFSIFRNLIRSKQRGIIISTWYLHVFRWNLNTRCIENLSSFFLFFVKYRLLNQLAVKKLIGHCAEQNMIGSNDHRFMLFTERLHRYTNMGVFESHVYQRIAHLCICILTFSQWLFETLK